MFFFNFGNKFAISFVKKRCCQLIIFITATNPRVNSHNSFISFFNKFIHTSQPNLEVQCECHLSHQTVVGKLNLSVCICHLTKKIFCITKRNRF